MPRREKAGGYTARAMNATTRVGAILLVGLGALAALTLLAVVSTPLPWWSALIILPLLDAALILWARRRMRRRKAA